MLAGVDIGGTKVLGIAVDPADPRTVVDEVRVPTPDGGDELMDAIAGVVRTLGERAGSRPDASAWTTMPPVRPGVSTWPARPGAPTTRCA